MDKPTCETCVFWEPIQTIRKRLGPEGLADMDIFPCWGEDTGGCNKEPHMLMKHRTDWCGKHPEFDECIAKAELESLRAWAREHPNESMG